MSTYVSVHARRKDLRITGEICKDGAMEEYTLLQFKTLQNGGEPVEITLYMTPKQSLDLFYAMAQLTGMQHLKNLVWDMSPKFISGQFTNDKTLFTELLEELEAGKPLNQVLRFMLLNEVFDKLQEALRDNTDDDEDLLELGHRLLYLGNILVQLHNMEQKFITEGGE